MIKKSFVLFVLLTIISCTPYINGVCRHKALYSALVYGDIAHKKVRIVWGPTSIKDIQHPQTQAFLEGKTKWAYQPGKKTKKIVYHAQAQTFINGKWEWLCQAGESVEICNQDDFYPIKYFTPQEFYDIFYGYLLVNLR